MKISDFLHEGRENAVSRSDLVRLTGMNDRTIRDTIKAENKKLALEGRAIISSSASRGYWITDDRAELEAYLKEQAHRSKMQYQNDAPIRDLVYRLGGSGRIRVAEHYRRLNRDVPEMEGQIKID